MRLLRIVAAILVSAVLWVGLFEYKTCACSEQLSVAERAVLALRSLGK